MADPLPPSAADEPPAGAAQTSRSPRESAPSEGAGSRFLRTAAYCVILVAGLKAASGLLVPVLAAALLAMISIPPMRWLQQRRIPDFVGLLIMILGLLAVSAGLTGIIGRSVRSLTRSLPEYQVRLDERITGWAQTLERFGWEGASERLGLGPESSLLTREQLTDTLVSLAGHGAEGALAILSQIFVILLITIFILLEASGFAVKMRRARRDPRADLSGFERITDQVYGYVFLKTGVSLLTGVLAGVLTAALGVDFPVLWGLLAFLFNFVPNIGSIIAAIPPVLLALVLDGGLNASLVAGGYLVINMAVGNMLEPRIMGRRLGLSPLVVLLSLIFWGWVLGPVGMILSLPMTMVIKVLLEASGDYRAAAILLGPSEVDPAEGSRP